MGESHSAVDYAIASRRKLWVKTIKKPFILFFQEFFGRIFRFSRYSPCWAEENWKINLEFLENVVALMTTMSRFYAMS